MNKPESGRVGSPQPVENDNSLFSAKELKISASSVYFVVPDWYPTEEEKITWDEGHYKTLGGRIVDLVADEHPMPKPSQMRHIKESPPNPAAGGRWRPCRIGYTDDQSRIGWRLRLRYRLTPVIIAAPAAEGEE